MQDGKGLQPGSDLVHTLRTPRQRPLAAQQQAPAHRQLRYENFHNLPVNILLGILMQCRERGSRVIVKWASHAFLRP